ncbi:nucleoprotein TPR [Mantella aurantiaca]
MAAVLQQVLERAELTKLPKAVHSKMERFLSEQQAEIDAMKSRHEKYKVDCEQQYFDVEKRLAQSQERLLSQSQECQSLRDQLSNKNEEQKDLNEKMKDLETSNVRLVALQSQLTRSKDSIDAEKRDLVRSNDRRAQELEHLNDDIKRLNEKLKEVNVAKVELQLKLDELQSSEVSVKYREKRLEQEKELLQTQNSWLNTELRSKTEELLSVHRDKGNEILKLKGSLENKKDEAVRFEDEIKCLKTNNENLQKQVEDLMNKLKEAKDQQSSLEDKFHNELKANVKLCNLYKSAAEDSEAKSGELTRAVEELHRLLKEAGEANGILQDQLSEMEAAKHQAEEDLREQIGKLEKELENANDLLCSTKRKGVLLSEEELTAMSPTAAAVAKVVRPGMKLTELYNAYMEAQDKLLIEKQENKRISKYLDDIVKEVEAKAPILKRQREEYERMQKSVTNLSAKLEQAMKEIQRMQIETDKANKLASIAERENQRLELQVKDLSQQIRVLLMELEESRGNHVQRDEDVSSANISSSSEVITRHLVTYRNIEELQEQNQRLLVTLRELGESKEREEQEVTSAQLSELRKDLGNAQTELEQLRENRQHQMHVLESTMRQRDMYRILLAQTTGVTLPMTDEVTVTSTPRKSPGSSQPPSTPTPAVLLPESTEAAEAKAALRQLQDVFENYRKEKAENDKILNEQNEKLQEQVTEVRSQNAKISTQLEFASKRYEMLQDNVESYRREIASLQEKSQKLSATTQKQEQIINTMTQDLRASNEKLALAEVKGENLKREKELLKMTETRLNQERESLLAEQRGQNLLLTNLQTIQVTLERSETEMRHRYNNQIERLENELSQVKKKLEHEVEQKHSLSKNQDVQILDLKRQYDSELNLHNGTKELLKNSNKEISTLKQQLTNFEAVLASRSSQPSAEDKDESGEDVEEIKNKLKQAMEQIGDLKERLQTTASNVDQYKEVVIGLEESLNKEKQITDETRKTIETRMKEASEYQAQLEKKLMEAEKEKQELRDEKHKTVENMEQQLSQLKQSLSSLQSEVQSSLQRAASAASNEQKARQDCQEQAKIATESQNKYERELMLHAADVEALQAAKEQLAGTAATRQKSEEAAQKAQSQLLECKASWEERERVLKDEVTKNQSRSEDLEKQNRLLHDQIETLSKKMMTSVQEGALNVSLSEEGKSQEQVMEILRFVRREKEIAEARFDVAQVECLRYRQRIEHMEKDVNELQDSLNAEREKVQACRFPFASCSGDTTGSDQNSRLNGMLSRNVLSVSAASSSSIPKRQREEEEGSAEITEHAGEDPDVPASKKQRGVQRVEPVEEVITEEITESETHSFEQESQDALTQFGTLDYQQIPDSEGTSQSLGDLTAQSDQSQSVQSTQHSTPKSENVIVVIDSDEEEEDENEGDQEDMPGYGEDEDDEDDAGMGDGDESNGEGGSADGNEAYEGEDAAGADGTDPGTETEESMGTGDGGQRPADSQNNPEAGMGTADPALSQEQPSSASDRPSPRPPQSPRRQPHPLPLCLTIPAPPPELGPPAQRIQMARRQSVGRGLQLTPGLGGMQHFFDDEDRTVPSTPTLVVPHRTDGFAEAIHSPQVAGVPRFRFGPPEDMTGSSHSDLGQLASQGGLGMYETPLFLAHEEESGGRSVPTTPLQVAAPVSVFAENPAADTSDHASQSVPMVTTSSGNVSASAESGATDEGDEVFAEAESEGVASESAMEMETRQEQETGQPSETDLPSTSQDPPTSSSSADTSSSQQKHLRRVRLHPQTGRPGVRGRQFSRQGGVPFGSRGGIRRSHF